MISAMHLLWLPVLLGFLWPEAEQKKYAVMIVSGQNNHDWQRTIGHLESALQDTDLFDITVSLAPPRESDPAEWGSWHPDFGAYSVVILAYNGEMWPESVRQDFENYIAGVGTGLLMAGYGAAITVNLLRGRSWIDCGCGGGEQLSWSLVVRNLVLAGFALLPLAIVDAAPRWEDLAVSAPVFAIAALMYLATRTLLENAAAMRVFSEPPQ